MWTIVALLALAVQAPVPVTGVVRDATGLPLAGATVTLEGTTRFAVTDERGAFALDAVPARATLVAAMPGFVPSVRRLSSDRPSPVVFVLSLAGLSESVAVRPADPPPADAGSTTITALDVVRTPGTQADLMRALATLPGVLRIDDGAGLFVRGGDVSEVRVLLDGVVVNHPYRYETPTGGFRGAVDPFLTSGASFTTGAFSAAYGNSLSAVLDLETRGRAEAPQTNVTAGLAGVSASFAAPIGANGGVRAAGNRTTPSLLFAVNPSPKTFDRLPGGWDASASASAASARFGQIRGTVLAQQDHVGVELEKDAFVGFLHSGTEHALVAVKWERGLGSRGLATISAGRDAYTKTTDVGVLALDERETHRSIRATARSTAGRWRLLTGLDADVVDTEVLGRAPARGGDLAGVSGTDLFAIAHRDWRAGLFGVVSRTDGRVTTEAGVRADRFDAADTMRLAPRASIRIGLGGTGAVRVAAGRYHQAVSPAYFDRVNGADLLRPMSATHLVVGFEHGAADAPVFARLEIYRKWYDDLPIDDETLGFSSDGYGSATGADLYAHRIWPRLDLSATASVLRARRRWTPVEQRDRYTLPAGTWAPDFEIPYSAQAIAKVPLPRGVSVAAGWRRAAGRPFTPAVGSVLTDSGYEPIWGAINSERLPYYQRLDLSVSLLTSLGRRSTAVFFASVDNVFDRQNTFEMAYSADYGERQPVTSSAPRAFYIGCSITR